MKVDGGLHGLSAAGDEARSLEAAGYSGGWTRETEHDGFLPLVRGVDHSSSLELGTCVAVAFARSPLTLAHLGWDMQVHSRGRFILGLGSQIRAHVTKRFGMPFDPPAPRMREMILAIRSIWDCWKNGTPLKFHGEFYRHTLMSEPYSPGRGELDGIDLPKIFLAGVGPVMSSLAGQVADGLVCSAFTTARYLREVTTPAVERGLAKAGRDRADFQIMLPLFIATGHDDESFESAVSQARSLVAFYGSTPAYRGVLELHGWGHLQDELNVLSKQARYDEMTALIDDDVLNTFTVVSEPAKLGAEIQNRYGGVAQRALFFFANPHQEHPDHWDQILADLKRTA